MSDQSRPPFTAPGAPRRPSVPTSHAVRSGGLLFCLGPQTPLDPVTGKLVEGSIGDQTAACLQNLAGRVCAAAGASLRDCGPPSAYT